MTKKRVEVVIIGGGPAGLSAALVLGRCRRQVLVFDSGVYRNAAARKMRGFLTRDHTTPEELRALARADVARYPSVEIVGETIVDVRRAEPGFVAVTAARDELHCDALLFATGFVDRQPAIPIEPGLHGDRVVPCPYCDGYEVRDEPLAAFSHPDDRGARFAFALSQWSSDLVFCSEATPMVDARIAQKLEARGVRIESRPVTSVKGERDGVRLTLSDGSSLWRRTMFYHLGGGPASDLPERLHLALDHRGGVGVNRKQAGSLAGVFAAGDATCDVLQAIVAAGEGASAAVSINEFLSDPDRT